jgi:transcriptional regulator with XRE-family HTH domain
MAKKLRPSEEFDPIFNRLIEVCEKRNTNVSSLCDEFATSRSVLSTWKKGNISANLIQPIAEKLNVSIEYLLTGKDVENTNFISTGDIKDNRDVSINNSNSKTKQLQIGEIEQEICSILSKFDTRKKTELMGVIYKYVDEHIKAG